MLFFFFNKRGSQWSSRFRSMAQKFILQFFLHLHSATVSSSQQGQIIQSPISLRKQKDFQQNKCLTLISIIYLWLVYMLLYLLMQTTWLTLCCAKPTCHHQHDIESKTPSQHESLFWGHQVTYRLAMLGQPVLGMRFNKRRLCPEEKGRSSTLIGAYGLSTYPGACWPLLNGISRKSWLCHCLQCGEAVSPSVFLAALETPE